MWMSRMVARRVERLEDDDDDIAISQKYIR